MTNNESRYTTLWASSAAQLVKNLPANARDSRDKCSIPGLGRCPGEGNGNPLQYSCLGNPMDRGALQATVHGVAKSQTWLSVHAHTVKRHMYLNICLNKSFLKDIGSLNCKLYLTHRLIWKEFLNRAQFLLHLKSMILLTTSTHNLSPH